MYLFTVDYKIYIGYNQITIIRGGEIHEKNEQSNLSFWYQTTLLS